MNPSSLLWLQIVVGVLTVMASGGLLLYILRRIDTQIKSKVDCDTCRLKHLALEKENSNIQKTLVSIQACINSIKAGQDEYKVLLARLDERFKILVGARKADGQRWYDGAADNGGKS